jgi:PhnB protein
MPQNPPEGYHTITPQLIVEDARETLDFIAEVFDGEILDVYESNGSINHAEAMIGDSRVMVASASSEFPSFPAMLVVYVDDVDAIYQRALEEGAVSLREPEDQFYGDRTGGVKDPQGNQWWISTHIEDVSAEEMSRRIGEMSA